MSLTYSTMFALGSTAPDFALTDVVSGQKISLSDFKNKKGLLVMFICNHCPYVRHVKEELAKIGRDYTNKGLGIVAISSNDAGNYPDDSVQNLKKMAEDEGFVFPLCFDETQQVAKKYKAACTPDFFLFDNQSRLVYRGQLDDSRPGNSIPVSGSDLRQAVNAVLEGKQVPDEQKPSTGCNIKWIPGNEPEYFS